MNDIQKARDVLAKWRSNRFNTTWEVDTNAPFSEDLVGLFADERKSYAVKFDDDEQPDIAVAHLIVGTAGNPDLLDAIDGLFKAAAADIAEFGETPKGLWSDASRIAAAIMSADERMTQ